LIPFVVLFLGLFLIFIEFFVPGGMMGILGSLFILLSFFLYGSESDSFLKTLFFVIFGLSLLVLVIKGTLNYLKNSRSDGGVTLYADQEGFVASSYDKNQIGKQATVLTDLKPGGRIVIEGKSYQALSMIRGEGESLIVKRSDL
jgi:membrane-bound serine protease (ClpP class)